MLEYIKLRRVTFSEGSGLEKIGAGCFSGTGLREIVLPGTLREIRGTALKDCPLRVVWVGDGCTACVQKCVDDSVRILPARDVPVGGKLLWDLRALGEVAIPESVRRIGDYWFRGSRVQSVHVPASSGRSESPASGRADWSR